MAQQPETRSVRLLRVGEQVRHALSEILMRGDVHDDVLASHPVSVTEVRMSPDLRHATVFVKPLLGTNEAAVIKALLATREDACIVASIHRPQLLNAFDEVVVVNAGRVVDQGTVTELAPRSAEVAAFLRLDSTAARATLAAAETRPDAGAGA